jgi:hypothetical protein
MRQVVKGLRWLKAIEVEGNPCCEVEGYSERLFEEGIELEIVDGQDKDGEEVAGSDNQDDECEEYDLCADDRSEGNDDVHSEDSD